MDSRIPLRMLHHGDWCVRLGLLRHKRGDLGDGTKHWLRVLGLGRLRILSVRLRLVGAEELARKR